MVCCAIRFTFVGLECFGQEDRRCRTRTEALDTLTSMQDFCALHKRRLANACEQDVMSGEDTIQRQDKSGDRAFPCDLREVVQIFRFVAGTVDGDGRFDWVNQPG